MSDGVRFENVVSPLTTDDDAVFEVVIVVSPLNTVDDRAESVNEGGPVSTDPLLSDKAEVLRRFVTERPTELGGTRRTRIGSS